MVFIGADGKMNIKQAKDDFPILKTKIYGKRLVYLDNAATTQKPKVVLDTVNDFYSTLNSNVHRGVHYLSEQSSERLEQAREKIKNFINAKETSEIIFTKGTTESINLVASSFGHFINEGDEVIITEMEHHSNIVPWQMICDKKKAKLRVIPIDDKGNLIIEELKKLITEKTRIIALTYVSNVMGCINPVKEVIDIAHEKDIPVLVDAAQAIQHLNIDVQKLDCDFLAFSGHKVYSFTGIGVLYAKKHMLERMPPYQGGGGMIDKVSFEKTTYAKPPLKFEAGTIDYAGAVSLGTAIDYLQNIGMENIREHEKKIYLYARKELGKIPGLTLYGNIDDMTGSISFNLDGMHHYDVGVMLDKLGIAIRTGHHCAQPLMAHLKVEGTIRASFALYNTIEDVDSLVEGIKKVKEMLDEDK